MKAKITFLVLCFTLYCKLSAQNVFELIEYRYNNKKMELNLTLRANFLEDTEIILFSKNEFYENLKNPVLEWDLQVTKSDSLNVSSNFCGFYLTVRNNEGHYIYKPIILEQNNKKEYNHIYRNSKEIDCPKMDTMLIISKKDSFELKIPLGIKMYKNHKKGLYQISLYYFNNCINFTNTKYANKILKAYNGKYAKIQFNIKM